jgi:alcohol dehydrogenase
VKVPAALPLDRAALFGCALLTGIGAVVNTARVPVGASVVVIGLGGVGLAAVLGARLAGAHPIIGIDPVPTKRATAEAVGATITIEPGPDTAAMVGELTGGGADFAFEAVGSASAMAAAFAATGRGGTTVAVGLPHPTSTLQLSALQVVAEERRLLGSYMGSAVPRRDIPRLVDLHLAGRLPLDDLISAELTLNDLNEGFDALADGQAVRQLVTIAPVTPV